MKRVFTTVMFAGSLAVVFAQQAQQTQSSTQQTQSSSQSSSTAQSGPADNAATSSRNRAEGPQSKLTPADQRFVMQAAEGGMMEVQAAKIAQEKAQREDVKALARRIEQDHTTANNELKSIAAIRDIQLPAEMGPKHRAHVDKLSALSGDAFDRAYVKQMISDHRKDISLFEKQAEIGFDSSLKTFASNTLPNLREHLRMAQEAQQAAKAKK